MMMRGQSMMMHGQSMMMHGQSMMMHGQRMMMHGQSMMMHGQSMMMHGQSMMMHGQSMMMHGKSMMMHGLANPKFSNLVIVHTYPPIKMEQAACSETSAYKIQTPGNYPEESIQLRTYNVYLYEYIFWQTDQFASSLVQRCCCVSRIEW